MQRDDGRWTRSATRRDALTAITEPSSLTKKSSEGTTPSRDFGEGRGGKEGERMDRENALFEVFVETIV